MPFWFRLSLYLIAVNIVVFFAAYRIGEYSGLVLTMFIVTTAYLALVIGRWLMGRKGL